MFYTYAHITSDTNRIFYIGKGSGKRLHRKDARNQHWHNTVAKHGYKAIKLADWKTSEEAFNHEKLLISCFKDMGHKLVNQSEGGDGNSFAGGLSFKGKKHSESAKEKCRLANIGKTVSEESKQKNREKHQKSIKINGIVYPSWIDASKKTNIPVGSFSYLIKGNPLKKWANYKLELVM